MFLQRILYASVRFKLIEFAISLRTCRPVTKKFTDGKIGSIEHTLKKEQMEEATVAEDIQLLACTIGAE